MSDYKDLRDLAVLGSDGDLHIPVRKFLDILTKRAMLHAETAARPGLDSILTELVRGQRLELQILTKALKDLVPQDG